MASHGFISFVTVVSHFSVDMSFRAFCSHVAALIPSAVLSGTRTDETDHCPAPYAYLATFCEKPRGSGCLREARKPQLSNHAAAPSVSFFSRCRQISDSWM